MLESYYQTVNDEYRKTFPSILDIKESCLNAQEAYAFKYSQTDSNTEIDGVTIATGDPSSKQYRRVLINHISTKSNELFEQLLIEVIQYFKSIQYSEIRIELAYFYQNQSLIIDSNILQVLTKHHFKFKSVFNIGESQRKIQYGLKLSDTNNDKTINDFLNINVISLISIANTDISLSVEVPNSDLFFSTPLIDSIQFIGAEQKINLLSDEISQMIKQSNDSVLF